MFFSLLLFLAGFYWVTVSKETRETQGPLAPDGILLFARREGLLVDSYRVLLGFIEFERDVVGDRFDNYGPVLWLLLVSDSMASIS